MFLTRWKPALVLLLAVFAAGAGVLLQPAGAARQAPTEREAGPAPGKSGTDKTQPDTDKLARTDRHGDPLPATAVARLGTIRLRHGDTIYAVALSPDGKIVASGSGTFESSVRLWDVQTGRELHCLQAGARGPGGSTAGMLSVAFSPDGKVLATGWFGMNVIALWEVSTGKRLALWTAHRLGVRSVAFSPDGQTLASSSYDKTIRLWEVPSGEVVREIKGHEDEVSSVAFAPDGKTLVSGSSDRTLRLWDSATGKEVRRFTGHEAGIASVAFLDGKTIVSGSTDKTVRLWDAATGRELQRLKGHQDAVSSVVCLPDGKSVVSAGRDGAVLLWEAATGKQSQRFSSEMSAVGSLALSANGKVLAAGGLTNGVALWDVGTRRELHPEGPKGRIQSACYAPDGKFLASGDTDGFIRLWEPATGKERLLAREPGWVMSLAFSPDGKALLSACYEKTFCLREVASGKELRRFAGHTGDVVAVAMTPDRATVASGSRDKTVCLWKAATGERLHELRGHQAEVNSVVFSPDGKLLASGAFRGRALLWDVVTGKELGRLGAADASVTALAFSADGKTLATVGGGGDGTLRFWDVGTKKELRRFDEPGPGLRGLDAVAFSPDGKYVLAGGMDTQVYLVETATGQEVGHFSGHLGSISAVAFSADGRTAVSGSRDSTLLLWDVTGRAGAALGRQPPLSPRELETLWADLAGADAARAHRALWALVGVPEQALPLLKERLRPAATVDPQRIRRLLADLESDRFGVRQQAARELEALEETAEATLRKALADQPGPEVRRRVEQWLERLEGSERPRARRAVAVLERSGTPEARQLLEKLAGGVPDAYLTQEARSALRRLSGEQRRR
jgi:WD40 repeat protein